MGIARPPTPSSLSHSKNNNHHIHLIVSKETADYLSINSMSQGFQQGIFSFSNGFNRSAMMHQDQQQQQQHMAQHRPQPLVAMEEVDSGELPVYESGGITMLSEMFNFQSGAATPPPAEMMENHITENYRLHQRPSSATTEWYGGNRLGMVGGLGPVGETKQHHSSDNHDSTSTIDQHHHHISSINADPATAMQLFLMNPRPRSPSPTSTTPTSSTPLHLLLPNPPTPPSSLQGYHSEAGFSTSPNPQTQFTWISSSAGGEHTGTQQLYNHNRTAGPVEGHRQGQGQGQGLSLSLSSLQHLEAVKAEEMRMGDGGLVYYNNQGSSSSSPYQMKNFGSQYQQQLHLQGMSHQNQNNQVHVGYSSSFGVINLLRNSKYAKAAQELLEEFCSVGRGHMKNNLRHGRGNTNPNNTNQSGGGGGGGGESSSLSKDLPPLSAADKIDYQRKKTTLLSMLDEVDRRYNHYCEQMQMVVNSFDSVMGYGAATPYTVLAQKAMSRHFRCLKDAIVGQLKIIRELVGEKDGVGSSGITKGETPRLKLLDQSLRQQRAFQQMGIMEQEAWRPQRGLPERSVTILRAWLFEHFLHPYPSDADKHLLARQTGLSRNQVSNWFINARVRLWKPMVEEMYQQESKDNEEDDEDQEEDNAEERERDVSISNNSAQTPTPSSTTTTTTTTATAGRRSDMDAFEKDSSLNAINRQCFSENQGVTTTTNTTTPYSDVSPSPNMLQRYHQVAVYGTTGASEHHGHGHGHGHGDVDSKLVRFGTTTTTGDVSLTLGLQHTGNLPENNQFSVNDYGGC